MKMLKKMKTAVGLLLATSMIISCTPSALAQSTTKKTMFSSQKDVSKSSTVSIFSVKPDYEDSNPHIAICWFDSDKSHTNYRVYRSKGDNLHYKELDISYTNTFYGSEKMFFAHDNPDFGYTYYYKVMPYTQNTPGEMSSELSTSYEYEMGDDVIVGLDKSKRPVLYFMNITRFTQKRAIYRATSKNGKYKKIAVTAKHCYYDKKAKKGKKYYYKVKGCYFDGKKTRLSKFSKTAVFNQKIGIINKIRIYRKSKSSIKLTWAKTVGATNYSVTYRPVDSSNNSSIKTVYLKNNYATIKGLKSEEIYEFVIRAYTKTKKNSADTAVSSVSFNLSKTEGIYPIVSKRSSTLKKRENTVKTTFTWNKVYGIDKYYVMCKDYGTGNNFVKVATVSKDKSSYTLTRKYNYNNKSQETQVKIVPVKDNVIIDSNRIARAYNTVKSVTKVSARRTSDGNVKICWRPYDANDDAKYYTVYKFNENGERSYVGATISDSLIDNKPLVGQKALYVVTFLDRSINATDKDYTEAAYDIYTNDLYKYNGRYSSYNPSYDFRIKFYNRLKKSKSSVLYTLKPSAPKIKTVVNSGKGQVTIDWKASSLATKYDIYRATSAKGKYKKIGSSVTTNFIDNKVKKKKTYYYKVVAKTKNNYGEVVSSKKSGHKSVKVTR